MGGEDLWWMGGDEGAGPVAHDRAVAAERRDLRQAQARTRDGRAARPLPISGEYTR